MCPLRVNVAGRRPTILFLGRFDGGGSSFLIRVRDEFYNIDLQSTFAMPTRLASDGPVPGLRLFVPAPGALDLRFLLKISCARASCLRRWRSRDASVNIIQKRVVTFIPALIIALKSAATLPGAMMELLY